jgi:hypothetical protein
MNIRLFALFFPSISTEFTSPGSGSAFRMRIQEANRMRIRIRNTGKFIKWCASHILPKGSEALGGRGCTSMGLLCKGGWQAAGAKLVARLMGTITGGVLGSLFSTSKSSVRPPPKNLASRRACLRGSTLVWDWLSILRGGGRIRGGYIRASQLGLVGKNSRRRSEEKCKFNITQTFKRRFQLNNSERKNNYKHFVTVHDRYRSDCWFSFYANYY